MKRTSTPFYTSLAFNSPGRPLVAVIGPTGSGKSALAVRIAQSFSGEIVNCDSVQIYRYFDIGTAKITCSERGGIPHHLIDIAEPSEVFTAGRFADLARCALGAITKRGRLPVVAGGTGFYLRALLDGLPPAPGRDDGVRARLASRERNRPGSLHRLLRRLDLESAARIHPNDVPKLVRALEIRLLSGKRASDQPPRSPLASYRVLKIGLLPTREALYQKLDARTEGMFSGGLLREIEQILERGVDPAAKPFESVGYRQALACLNQEMSLNDAIAAARQATRNYAKRQFTWFRREPGLEFMEGFGDDPEIQAHALGLVERHLLD